MEVKELVLFGQCDFTTYIRDIEYHKDYEGFNVLLSHYIDSHECKVLLSVRPYDNGWHKRKLTCNHCYSTNKNDILYRLGLSEDYYDGFEEGIISMMKPMEKTINSISDGFREKWFTDLKEKESMTIKKSESEHYVYIIRGLGTPYCKIGMTNNIEKRMRAIKTYYPSDIELECLVSCKNRDSAFEMERLIHSHLKDCRSNGEWFCLYD